jgi:hypothetical protein
VGSLAGTPLYMAPEQAAARHDEVGPWSDVYALCVVLYEWLLLEHPHAKATTVQEVLASIIARDYTWSHVRDRIIAMQVPMEYYTVFRKGLQRDRAHRFASVSELEKSLEDILAGRLDVRCHVTFTKGLMLGLIHWIDRHTVAYSLIFAGVMVSLLGSLVYGVVRLVHLAH